MLKHTCLAVLWWNSNPDAISGKAMGILFSLSPKREKSLTALSAYSGLFRKWESRRRLREATELALGSAPSWSVDKWETEKEKLKRL